MSKNQPTDKKLYESVKKRVKKVWTKDGKTWPSIYGSSFLVKEYKKAFKKKHGSKKSPYRNKCTGKCKDKDPTGLERWYLENWVNACDKNKKCGRKVYKKTGQYPYCRPSVRVNSKTPKTIGEMTKAELKKLCSKKQKVRGKKKMKAQKKKK